MDIEVLLFYILLVDAIGANLLAHFGRGTFQKYAGIFARWFPLTKGWTLYYLLLVLWAGSLLYRAGMLF